MKLSLKVLALALLAVLSCGQPPTPSVDSGKLGPTADPLPIAEHPEVGGVTLVHGDFTPEEWAFATAPRPATNPRANKDTRSLADFKRDACMGAPTTAHPEGEWRCKGPRPTVFAAASGSTPILPVSWRVPTWYFDNANSSGTASDTNDCVTSVTPCATWGEIWVHRLGAGSPQLQQVTTFHMMSAQTLNVDPIFGAFSLQNGNQSIMDCRSGWVNAGAAYALGALSGGYGFAAATQSAGGVEMTQAGPPGYVVQGVLLNNTIRSSYAIADTATTITQPLTIASLTTTTAIANPVADNDWVAGDNIQPVTLPLINLKGWMGAGGDVSSVTQPSATWTIGCAIADSSGAIASEYPLQNTAANNVLSTSLIGGRMHTWAGQGRGNANYVIGSYVIGQTFQYGGQLEVFGGALKGGLNNSTGIFLGGGNVVIHTSLTASGGLTETTGAAGIFSDVTWNIFSSEMLAGAPVWGSYNVVLNPNTAWVNSTGSTFVLKATLTSGTLKFGANTTGFTSPNCGTFTNNGITQVDTTPAGGTHWPAGSTFSWSLNTVGGTACLAGGPYFSAAITADNLFTKAVTVNCNDVYNYCALPASVSITAANLDLYNGLQDINTGARFSNTQ